MEGNVRRDEVSLGRRSTKGGPSSASRAAGSVPIAPSRRNRTYTVNEPSPLRGRAASETSVQYEDDLDYEDDLGYEDDLDYEGNWEESESVERDPLRTRLVIIAGALAGILIVLVALLLLQTQRRGQLAAAGNAGGASNSGSALPAAPIVGRYPPDFTLTTLDGKSVTLSSLRGKPVWINFWATWCPPCRAEMPEMKLRYAKFKDQGLVILGVDNAENPDTVKQFTSSNGYDWTFLLDSDTAVGQQYYVTGIPTHIFVGKDGIIKAIQVGGIPGTMMDRYLGLIMN